MHFFNVYLQITSVKQTIIRITPFYIYKECDYFMEWARDIEVSG